MVQNKTTLPARKHCPMLIIYGRLMPLNVGLKRCFHFSPHQWRRQLVGTWARAPLAFERIFSARLFVCFFCLVLCQTLNLAPLVQPYSLWNNTITSYTGYNGASAKVNVVFTARRYALARSMLLAGVCPSVRHVRVLYPDG